MLRNQGLIITKGHRYLAFIIAVPLLFSLLIQPPIIEHPLTEGASQPTLEDAPTNMEGSSQRVSQDDQLLYAILTPTALKDSLIPLRDWKTQKGVPAQIYTLDYIYGVGTGYDDAQKVHNFLQLLYEEHPELEWLLLVGDHGVFPTRALQTNGSFIDPGYIDDYCITDSYFSVLWHTWDSDNDHIWGEKNQDSYIPDLYVGRLPVENTTELDIVVNKILTYERDPPIGDWMRSALLVSTLLDTPNNVGNATTQSNDWSGWYEWWRDNAHETITKTLPHFENENMTEKLLYDYPLVDGGFYNPSGDTLDDGPYIYEFNKGYSIITTDSHGWTDGDGATNYVGNGNEPPQNETYPGTPANVNFDEFYYWTDARDASNGNRLPLWFAASCDVGNFSEDPDEDEVEDTNFELLLTNPNGGAIGLIAPNAGTARGENLPDVSLGNVWLLENYWRIFFDGCYQPGKALALLKAEYEDYLIEQQANWLTFRQNKAAYNLLGDPEIQILTAIPTELSVKVANLYSDGHLVSVSVTDELGAPVPDARVCFSGPLYHFNVTDDDGNCTLFMSPSTNDVLTLTVTAHNHLVYEDDLTVQIEPADLAISNSSISLSDSTPSNQDSITVSVEVTNEGATSASDVKVRFFDGDPDDGGVAIGDSSIASLSPLENAIIQTSWSPSFGVHELYVVVDPLGAIPESDETNNRAYIIVNVSAPDLSVNAGDLHLKTNEPHMVDTQMYLNLTVSNIGLSSSPSANVSVFLGASSTGAPLWEGSVPPIPQSGNAYVEFPWTVLLGPQNIFVDIDHDNHIEEMNEDNNNLTFLITGLALPVIQDMPDINLSEDDTTTVHLVDHINDADTPFNQLALTITSLGLKNDSGAVPSNSDTYLKVASFGTEGYNEILSLCSINLSHEKVLEVAPSQNWFGELEVALEISDGTFTTNNSMLIRVLEVNDPPDIAPIGGPTKTLTVYEDRYFSYQVNATDVDGDSLQYSVNRLLNITETGLMFINATNDDVGTYTIKITVTDGRGKEDTEVFEFEIKNRNDPPSFEPVSDLEAEVGKEFRHWFIASDVDRGDVLTFSDDTELFDIDPTSGEAVFTPTKDDAGVHQVTIMVQDSFLAWDTITFDLSISGEGDDSSSSVLGKSGLVWGIIISAVAGAIIIVVFLKLRSKGHKAPKSSEKSYDDEREVLEPEIEHELPFEERREPYNPPIDSGIEEEREGPRFPDDDEVEEF